MLLILFFVLLLNVVAIALTYHCLTNLEKKDRIIFVGVGIAIIYILTSFVYWISTKDIAINEVSESGKNIITFLFVPINSIVILPIFAKSYVKYKEGRLATDKLRNRVIVLAVILLIVLIIECAYFKNIQNGVVELIKENNTKENVINEIIQNETINNTQQNLIVTNELVDEETNNSVNTESMNNSEQNILENVIEENIVDEIE